MLVVGGWDDDGRRWRAVGGSEELASVDGACVSTGAPDELSDRCHRLALGGVAVAALAAMPMEL